MRNIKLARFAVILFLLTAIVGCGKPKALQYVDTTNLRVNNLNSKQSDISADIKFFNPNNYKIQLRRAEMNISINNRFIGHSVLDTTMELPRRDTFMIPVRLKLDLTDMLSNALNVLLMNEVNVKLEGSARLGKGGLFFNFPFSYEGKQKLHIFQ